MQSKTCIHYCRGLDTFQQSFQWFLEIHSSQALDAGCDSMRKLRTGSQTWRWGVHTLLQVDSEKAKQREWERQRWSWGNSWLVGCLRKYSDRRNHALYYPGPLCSQRHSDDFYTSLYHTVLSGLFMAEYTIIITLFTSLFKHFIHLCM